MLSLPLQAREVYRILLMVPVGAFVCCCCATWWGQDLWHLHAGAGGVGVPRNQVLAGIILFVVVISAGLLVRFYMERLRLLLVPRLTAVLILVVLLMAAVSVIRTVWAWKWACRWRCSRW